MRVLICGGRDYSDWDCVFGALDRVHAKTPISLVIEGGASGADWLAKDWAKQHRIEVATYEADWSLGRSAGPLRNRQMLADGKPEAVIAFPGGRGTADMIRQAAKAGVPVIAGDEL